MKRTRDDIIIRLKSIYNLYAIWWEEKRDYVGLMEETYSLLLELKEMDATSASEEAKRLIRVARTWDLSVVEQEVIDKWNELRPLFEEI